MAFEWARGIVTATDRSRAILHKAAIPPGEALMAILDGASAPNLPVRIFRDEPEAACLLGENPAPDLAWTAPYLARIEPPSPFVSWALGDGWGHHWGIYLTSKAPFPQLLAHFRKLLRARLPSGQDVFFRFFDPRVLAEFLPTCDDAQVEALFGPVTQFLFEGRDGRDLVRFRKGPAPLAPTTEAL
jgi:hypothetical protein